MNGIIVVKLHEDFDFENAKADIMIKQKGKRIYRTHQKIRPMPKKKMPKRGEAFPQSMVLIDRWKGYDECIDEIFGEAYESE